MSLQTAFEEASAKAIGFDPAAPWLGRPNAAALLAEVHRGSVLMRLLPFPYCGVMFIDPAKSVFQIWRPPLTEDMPPVARLLFKEGKQAEEDGADDYNRQVLRSLILAAAEGDFSFVGPDFFEPNGCDSCHMLDLQPSTNGKPAPRRKGTVSQRILDTIDKRPESVNWSQREWAQHLKCSPSTVAEAPAWKTVQGLRAMYRAQKATRQPPSARQF